MNKAARHILRPNWLKILVLLILIALSVDRNGRCRGQIKQVFHRRDGIGCS